jgi:hypothetical protein
MGSNGYQWFGSDGSMVGCNAESSCVGFGADGTIAISPHPDGESAVYDVKGNYVGTYRIDGSKAAPASSPLSLAAALAATGVDVSALVAAGTGRLAFAGGVTGDPHLITAGGVRFTTQLTGQYVARGGDPFHAIQLRFAPVPHRRDVSLVSDAVIGSVGDTVDVSMAGDVVVSHVSRPPTSKFQQFGLASGMQVGVWPRDASRVVTVAAVWPDTASVVVTANPALGLTVVGYLPRDPAAVGLFGSGALGAGSDLVGRSGVSQDVAGIVSSWQVTQAELLFDSPISPDPGFPQAVATLVPATIPAAQAACRAAGLVQLEDRAACVFDAALTGDDGFVAGHRLMAVPAESTLTPSAVWALWPALLIGSVNPTELPAGGVIDATLNSGQSQAYRVPVASGGTITLVHQRGCSGSVTPGIGSAALRIFDSTGHPVSPRLALCGREDVSDLEPGTYSLVVASGTAHSPTHARLQVSVLP